jgi:phage-related protein
VNAPRKVPVLFFRTRAGAEVVRDWLRSLDDPDRAVIGQDLMRVQFRWPIGMPLCRPLKDGLWEVRSSLPSGRIARVLFCQHDGALLILSGFIKKSQRTPDEELMIARKRMREFTGAGHGQAKRH